MNLLMWISLCLFLISFALKGRNRFAVAAFGWIVMCAHWIYMCGYYLNLLEPGDRIPDEVDSALSVFVAGVCLMIARRIWARREELIPITKLAALTCLIYFPFSEIPILKSSIIHATAWITAFFLNLLGVNAVLSSPYIFFESGRIEIILPCTAIESIAIFTAAILSVNADPRKRLKAFTATVPTIYCLNLIRNVYVSMAYVGQWYGSPLQSFYMAHHVISKIGSTIALFALAFILFTILPEVLRMIENGAKAVIGK